MTDKPNPCPHCHAAVEIDGFGYYHEGTETHEIRCKNPDCNVKPYIIQTQDEESDFDLVGRWNDQDFDEPV